MQHTLLTCAAIVGSAAVASSASALTFTFDDPGIGAEFDYSPVDSTIDYVGGLVDFVVTDDQNFFRDADPIVFSAQAEFYLSGTVTPATMFPIAPGFSIMNASVSGDFGWRDADTGEDIVTGTFSNASLTLTPGGFNLAATAGGSGLAYFIGSALEDFQGLTLANPADANWTLTAANFAGGTPTNGDPNGDDDIFFAAFTANSAFSGTVVLVPSPGSLAITGLAGLVAIRRNRR